MITNRKLLSAAMATALIGGAGFAAAGPVAAAPATPSTSVPSMTMGQMTITITDFAYSMTGTITPGSLISVTNNDKETHTVTADNGAFDVTVAGGQTATFAAPSEGGDYGFFCKFHGNMKGTLTVAAGAATASPAPAAPAPSAVPSQAAPAPSAVPSQAAPAPSAVPSQAGATGMKGMEGMDQMGAVPRGGADTGAEQPAHDATSALVLGGGLSLVILAGGAYAVRRRTTS